MHLKWIIPAAAMLAATPAVAQTGSTDSLNREVDANVSATEATNAQKQAQYEQDVAEYRAKVRMNDRDQMRYDRQQRAYADAMHQWRVQVALCEAGHTKVCKMPPPDPASFY